MGIYRNMNKNNSESTPHMWNSKEMVFYEIESYTNRVIIDDMVAYHYSLKLLKIPKGRICKINIKPTDYYLTHMEH
jgi:hypothetical protein